MELHLCETERGRRRQAGVAVEDGSSRSVLRGGGGEYSCFEVEERDGGFQTRVHYRGGEEGSGRRAEEIRADGGGNGSVEEDFREVREHVEQQRVVRARVSGGAREDGPGRQGFADLVRVRFQVRERRLDIAAQPEKAKQEPLV